MTITNDIDRLTLEYAGAARDQRREFRRRPGLARTCAKADLRADFDSALSAGNTATRKELRKREHHVQAAGRGWAGARVPPPVNDYSGVPDGHARIAGCSAPLSMRAPADDQGGFPDARGTHRPVTEVFELREPRRGSQAS